MTGFVEAVLAGPNPLIMEIKKKDAAGRDLLNGRSVPEIVEAYHLAGAPCISVVTGRWFGGNDELLRQVRSLTHLPILQKDFITRRDQLLKASDLGASAVLLTAQLLPVKGLNTLAEHAAELKLTPFIEVVSEVEIGSIHSPAGSVMAVNNKDIRNRERGPDSVGRSIRLIDAVKEAGTPCAVSASGIDSPDTALRLLRAGYQALLVGTAVLSGQPEEWAHVTSGSYRTGTVA
ncbi:indole-3-glycerol phosphate synthase [Arthrobacter sp. AFG7.2]|nr:indole-3-glycerol phosphate synthase [Arthrobacter sp. AFG7.2]